MSEFEHDPIAINITENCYRELARCISPFLKKEFIPQLDDDVAEDYGMVNEDLEEFLLNLLQEYDLPKKDIRGNDKKL